MSKRNFWIGVVFGCAVMVASCSKTESPVVGTSDKASANIPNATPSIASPNTDFRIMNFLPDPDFVFVTDYTAGEGKAGQKGVRVAVSDSPAVLFRLHMDVNLKNAKRDVLEKALRENNPKAFLAELKKEPHATDPGHRGMATLKMALGCTDATDSPDKC